ncbi:MULTISPECIES: T9SS type A sorting domain-containing protein [unclassified Flavobacterium]|uniref:T9SS type A sorting domain-containing protein n=1 Tax=unclassified Flavobacterium TaxID=196869 RepID=UPI001F143A1C|nr:MULTISPECIES: T9SS type A sorting domain-containing protein [unclassified Flavobacterium]UMY66882.1 T9SS type A sorting domain-containing protein [Flavobacterium sp. HJ-32-4]
MNRKILAFLLFGVVAGTAAQTPLRREEFINSGALSANISCGIGEIVIMPSVSSPRKNNDVTTDSKFTVYPNPFSDSVTLQSSYPLKRINIVSLDGRLLLSFPFENGKKIPLGQLSPGTYLLITDRPETKTIKLIKP